MASNNGMHSKRKRGKRELYTQVQNYGIKLHGKE
jgi:hypothetical protein